MKKKARRDIQFELRLYGVSRDIYRNHPNPAELLKKTRQALMNKINQAREASMKEALVNLEGAIPSEELLACCGEIRVLRHGYREELYWKGVLILVFKGPYLRKDGQVEYQVDKVWKKLNSDSIKGH